MVRYLIRARAQAVRPIDVSELYQRVADNRAAVAWLDLRFQDRTIPPGWREIENEIEELAYEAADAGIKLEQVSQDLLETEDPLQRLRCLIKLGQRREPVNTTPLPADRLPNLEDLIETSRRRIELFAIEEGFYYGLPPIETTQLYEDVEADPRALQYLNRRFEFGEEPDDWSTLRHTARELAEGYNRLGYLPSAVLGEQHPRTSERGLREILDVLATQLDSLGGAVAR